MQPTDIYKCLADITKIKLVSLLFTHKELAVHQLVEAIGVSQPKVSRHLHGLRGAQLVRGRREGKWVYYRLHEQLPDWAQQVIALTATEELGLKDAAQKP